MTAHAPVPPAVAPFHAAGPTALEQIGFELGWDHARHGLSPRDPYARESSPLRDGWVAGQAAFGSRTLAPTRAVRQWLRLRLQAWLRGRSVELIQVTPNYLRQIEVGYCPITRVALSTDAAAVGVAAASIDRVRDDAGYAAGNLAVMSLKANHAKASSGWRDALAVAQRIEAEQLADVAGLDAAEWARVASLCSLVEPIPHAEASALPLRVLPPNRLRLLNPVQALQALLSRQLLQPGWSRRIGRFEDLLASRPLQRDFKAFFMALLPRVLEAGKLADAQATRWAIEDAWSCPRVLQRWTRFAQQLDPARCEALLTAAAAQKLTTWVIESTSDAQATDGWMLDHRGYVPHVVPAVFSVYARQGQLAF